MILKPSYDFQQPNDSILLTQAKISVLIEGKVHKGDAKVHLDLLPDASIHIYTSLPHTLSNQIDDIKELTVVGKKLPVFSTKVSTSSGGKFDVVWCLRKEPITGLGDQSTSINSVVFHLFNYKGLFGARRSVESVGKASHAIQHVDIKANGWNIELKSLPTTSETLKTLGETGGYGLTHIGCLQKEDGSSFEGKTAEEMLAVLRFFLSFSKGMWCNPCLAVGFDNEENRVWEAWDSPKGRWAKPSSWFDPYHCEQLISFFPGFMDRWKNEEWREALQEVIYWYLSSNCSTLGRDIGIDAGIILTQAAIERLSFEYAVRHKKLIEVNGFKNLRASDKFRLLLSSLGISIGIPSQTPELQKLAKKFNWPDAPHALTEVRNSLVHPEHKYRSQFGSAFYEAWNLGLWYLELSILRICGYSGSYSNRLVSNKWVGTVENVPWVS